MLTAGSISLSDSLVDFFNQTGFAGATWGNIAMILVAFLLLYLAIKHKFEPVSYTHLTLPTTPYV